MIRKVKLPKDLKKEIIVVDDGSSDLTPEILKNESKFFKYFRHKKNSGKGAAVRTGLKIASGEIFIIQDADLEYNPEDYNKLLEPILKNGAEVVYGTRLIDYPLKFWGKNKTVLPMHLIANRFLTFLTNLLYFSNITDMETCYKVFTKKAIESIELKSNKFDIEPEITAKFFKKGIRIYEIPIITHPRTYKEGKKINWIDGLIAIWTILKYRLVD